MKYDRIKINFVKVRYKFNIPLFFQIFAPKLWRHHFFDGGLTKFHGHFVTFEHRFQVNEQSLQSLQVILLIIVTFDMIEANAAIYRPDQSTESWEFISNVYERKFLTGVVRLYVQNLLW